MIIIIFNIILIYKLNTHLLNNIIKFSNNQNIHIEKINIKIK